MGIEKRRFVRFSLDVPAVRYYDDGKSVNASLRQISVGGCMIEWNDDIKVDDVIRLELTLPNRNRLPVTAKVLYKAGSEGFGMRFLDICQFEQELVAKIISHTLEAEGLPLTVDPFVQPPTFISKEIEEVGRPLAERLAQIRQEEAAKTLV